MLLNFVLVLMLNFGFAVSLVHAAEQPPGQAAISQTGFLVGHNLTATSDVLEGKTCTIGLQVAACRVAQHTAVGFSTWMLLDYKMYTAAVRHLISEDSDGNRWATQVSYFQTYLNPNDKGYNYEMRALWVQGIRTFKVRDDYRLHVNLDANYYFNDRRPFSLRRPSITQTPVQINLSSLHQVALYKGWVMLGELGLLDLFRAPIHTHSGVSIGYDGGWYSWHLGYSLTATLIALFAPSDRLDYQQAILDYRYSSFDYSSGSAHVINDGYDGVINEEHARFDYALHPEFAAQFTF